MLSKDDPCRGVFEEVARWNNTVACLPSWNELLEVEYVRSRGEVNMFTDNVARYCFDRGLLNAFEWYERCRIARIHPAQLFSQAIAFYETEHGPHHTWITQDLRDSFEELELDFKEAQLATQLRELRAKKRSVKSRTKR